VLNLRRRIKGKLSRARDAHRVRESRGALPAFWFTGRKNFGDLIAPAIIEHRFGISPILVSGSFSGKILGPGSILHRAVPGDVVWGAGLFEERAVDGRGVRFLAVRGPRSRSCIRGEVPRRYGDPGMLLPSVYTPRRSSNRFDIGVMPHYHDKDAMRVSDSSVLFIDVQDPDWRATLDRVVSCDVLVTSSLHGIIVADAYGVPVVWVQPTNAIKGGQFKFRDYFEGTDREGHLSNWKHGLAKLVDEAEASPTLDLSGLLRPQDSAAVATLRASR